MTRAPKKTATNITELRADFSYNPRTGVMTWAYNSRYNRSVGMRAGYVKADGYVRIKYRGIEWLAHVLIWAWVYGAVPEEFQIDHINGKRDDNSIKNLRLLTPAENMVAIRDRKRSNAAALPLGVTLSFGKYLAQISFRGENIALGKFDCADMAGDAYQRAAVLVMRGQRPSKELIGEAA